jgi:hypothetical protein
MLSEQDKLPRLPINTLEDAIQDFLRASEPLLSPKDYALTKQQADDFLKDQGPSYHKLLTEYDAEDGRNSYLEVSCVRACVCFCACVCACVCRLE